MLAAFTRRLLLFRRNADIQRSGGTPRAKGMADAYDAVLCQFAYYLFGLSRVPTADDAQQQLESWVGTGVVPKAPNSIITETDPPVFLSEMQARILSVLRNGNAVAKTIAKSAKCGNLGHMANSLRYLEERSCIELTDDTRYHITERGRRAYREWLEQEDAG